MSFLNMNQYNEENFRFVIDEVTGQQHSLADEISFLKQRILQLEDRCRVLEEENISTTNSLYEIANSLEQRIDILADHRIN